MFINYLNTMLEKLFPPAFIISIIMNHPQGGELSVVKVQQVKSEFNTEFWQKHYEIYRGNNCQCDYIVYLCSSYQ